MARASSRSAWPIADHQDMDTHPEKNLEELIHRELRQLPERPAPDTLLPRVLQQIQARAQKRWWQRSWTHWPFAVQLASLPLMLGSVAAATFGLAVLWRLVAAQAAL